MLSLHAVAAVFIKGTRCISKASSNPTFLHAVWLTERPKLAENVRGILHIYLRL